MKVRDFQFIKHFLVGRQDIPERVLNVLLDTDVDIVEGEADHITTRSNTIVYNSPTSIMKFLFNTTYNLLIPFLKDPLEQDKASIAILHLVRDYVYLNYDKSKNNRMPVICSFDKVPIPTFIIKELIEPLVGKINLPKLFFHSCNFTDACRYVSEKDFILVNDSIYNKAATTAHLTFLVLELNKGTNTASKIIKKLLLDKSSNNLANMITILKFLEVDSTLPFEFLNILQSHVTLLPQEMDEAAQLQYDAIANDERLQGIIKQAYGNYTPQVFHQWSQWSMLMGLIEKQLGHMRGSFWPASELVGPHEDKKRKMILEVTKEKGKNQLTTEELLEVARNWYGHNATEPGKLFEKILKEERVWN